MTDEARTLAQVPPGARACVVTIEGDGPLGQRLAELGLVPGVEIRFVREAPLGDPLEFELMGYHLSLRKSEAAAVQVKLL